MQAYGPLTTWYLFAFCLVANNIAGLVYYSHLRIIIIINFTVLCFFNDFKLISKMSY